MNNTLNNGLRLLEFLANSAATYSVKELAQHFDLPNSHICRLLKSLAQTGYIEQDQTRKYRISPKILCLGNACLAQMTVRNRVRPYLIDLTQHTQCETYLAMPLGGQPLIVDVIYPGGRTSDVAMTIGQINKLHVSACGKLCAAYQEEAVQELLMQVCEFESYTCHTIANQNDFREELKRIRTQEYAVADAELSDDTYAVAAPILGNNGAMLAAIGTYFHHANVTAEEKATLISLVRDAAKSASFAMGFI